MQPQSMFANRNTSSLQHEVDHTGGSLELKLSLIKQLGTTFLEELGSLTNHRELALENGIDFYEEVRRFEIELIECALKQTGGHQRAAANLLNLKPTTLNTKIKIYNIPVKAIPEGHHEPDPADSTEHLPVTGIDCL